MKLNNFPTWLKVDEAYLTLLERELYNFTPWEILLNEEYEKAYKSLEKNYPKRELVPFASRCDNDDIACWEKGKDNQVFIIHNYASSGWESRGKYKDFWTWFKNEAVEEMIFWGYDGDISKKEFK